MHTKTRNTLIIGIGTVVVAVIAAFVWFMAALRPVGNGTGTQSFTIATGEGVKVIANNLTAAGVLRNAFAFRLHVALERRQPDLQAGTYAVAPSMSAQDLLQLFVAGDATTREMTITTLGEWSIADIAAYLEAQRLFPAEDFVAAASVTDSRTLIPDVTYAFLREKPATASLEGFLFPDTYKVFRDAKPADVIRKMLDTFEKKVYAPLETDFKTSARTFYENLTLASMLEREVIGDSDRRNAADVFLKRLRDGIALQSDATVSFAVGRATLTAEDLAVDSPYNTYRYTGLPVGPIDNPTLSSIRAALQPEANPYYYFLTKSDQTAVFATTYAEHLANKAKYLGT